MSGPHENAYTKDRILKYIAENPLTRPAEIAKGINANRATVCSSLSVMLKNNMVTFTKDNRGFRQYYLTQHAPSTVNFEKSEALKEANKVWNEFWSDIVMKDGQLDVNQIKLELLDYYRAMQEVPKVYCEITGGLLSKILYPADTVITNYQDFRDREFHEWFDEEMELKCDECKAKQTVHKKRLSKKSRAKRA